MKRKMDSVREFGFKNPFAFVLFEEVIYRLMKMLKMERVKY
jgi:hypothetical protein